MTNDYVYMKGVAGSDPIRNMQVDNMNIPRNGCVWACANKLMQRETEQAEALENVKKGFSLECMVK